DYWQAVALSIAIDRFAGSRPGVRRTIEASAGALRRALGNAICRGRGDYKNRERDVIVIEPMPSNHDPLPLFERPFLLASRVCLPHPCFRAISTQGFLASWFGAKTWRAFRNLWQKLERLLPPGRAHHIRSCSTK